jgi:hypothetical protein
VASAVDAIDSVVQCQANAVKAPPSAQILKQLFGFFVGEFDEL